MKGLAHILGALCVLGTGLGGASLAAEPVAPVSDDQRAGRFNAHLDKALAAKGEGRLEGALGEFDLALLAIRDASGEAWDAARARVQYQRALILMELERFADARALLVALQLSPGLEPQARHVVRTKLQLADERLAAIEASRAPVEVSIEVTNAPGAAVSVGGEELGPAPQRLERPPGRYAVVVRHPDFLPYRTELTLSPGRAERLELTLERAPSGLSDGQLAAIVAGSVAGVALIAGGVLHGLGESELSEADSGDLIWREAKALADSGEAKRTAAFVAYGVAGAAAITAVVLLAVDPGGSQRAARVDVTWSGQSAGLSLSGRF